MSRLKDIFAGMETSEAQVVLSGDDYAEIRSAVPGKELPNGGVLVVAKDVWDFFNKETSPPKKPKDK